MESIGIHKARIHLSKIIERVSHGDMITITRYGRPVAFLQAPPCQIKARSETAIAEIRKFRRELTREGITIRSMIDEGRR